VLSFDDVARLALALPETEERPMHGLRAWRVHERLFVWERPLRRADLDALGPAAPQGLILGARVENLMEKEALLENTPEVFFTTPHFEGNPSVLVRLDRIEPALLEEVVTEAWLARAPRRLGDRWLEERAAR
jgi:hypothetical protein